MKCPPPIFIGDEVTAAGYRLAGAKVLVPPPGEEALYLEQARGETWLVLISAGCAARIPRPAMTKALAAATPLLLVVPGIQQAASWPDLAVRLRTQLGLEL